MTGCTIRVLATRITSISHDLEVFENRYSNVTLTGRRSEEHERRKKIERQGTNDGCTHTVLHGRCKQLIADELSHECGGVTSMVVNDC